MKNIIKKFIPKPIKSAVRDVIYLLSDNIDLLLSRRDPLTPPPRLMHDSFSESRNILDFKKEGEEYLRYYTELCDLKSNDKILDVGCGVGRRTVPLTKYLDGDGRYEGVDIYKVGIDWCRKRISKRYPNFHFQLVDMFNKMYNPKGKYKASEYRFPFKNESFDFVVLGSVFTHMLPKDMENYFSEIARVLKIGGRCFITFFLLNKESLQLINAGKSTIDFKHEFEKFRAVDPHLLEDVICYDEAFILSLYEKYGLKIKQPIHYGSWSSRPNFLSHQDIIIASKG
jgi:SAM-dependent methyltransferase